jgi:hypothetical protein
MMLEAERLLSSLLVKGSEDLHGYICAKICFASSLSQSLVNAKIHLGSVEFINVSGSTFRADKGKSARVL